MEGNNIPGKWGRAISIEGEQAALKAEESQEAEKAEEGGKQTEGAERVAKEVDATPVEIKELVSLETHIHTVSSNMNICDLYEVGHETVTREICEDQKTEFHLHTR